MQYIELAPFVRHSDCVRPRDERTRLRGSAEQRHRGYAVIGHITGVARLSVLLKARQIPVASHHKTGCRSVDSRAPKSSTSICDVCDIDEVAIWLESVG